MGWRAIFYYAQSEPHVRTSLEFVSKNYFICGKSFLATVTCENVSGEKLLAFKIVAVFLAIEQLNYVNTIYVYTM